jgi:hypothetical protein
MKYEKNIKQQIVFFYLLIINLISLRLYLNYSRYIYVIDVMCDRYSIRDVFFRLTGSFTTNQLKTLSEIDAVGCLYVRHNMRNHKKLIHDLINFRLGNFKILLNVAGTSFNVAGTLSNVVGTSSNVVGTSFNVVGTLSNVVGTSSNVVGTLSNVVGTSFNVVVTSSNVAVTLSNVIKTSLNRNKKYKNKNNFNL